MNTCLIRIHKHNNSENRWKYFFSKYNRGIEIFIFFITVWNFKDREQAKKLQTIIRPLWSPQKSYLFQENKNQILASKKSLKIDSDTHCWLKVGLVLRFDLWLRVGVISFMYTLSLYSLLMTQSYRIVQ